MFQRQEQFRRKETSAADRRGTLRGRNPGAPRSCYRLRYLPDTAGKYRRPCCTPHTTAGPPAAINPPATIGPPLRSWLEPSRVFAAPRRLAFPALRSGCLVGFALGCQPLLEAAHVDHHALMGAATDLLGLVARADIEFDASTVDARDHGFGRDIMSDRRRGEVADVDRGADRAFARIQVAADGVEGGILHRRDHHRRREYLREHRILEPVGEMRRPHAQCERSLRSQWNRLHALL